MIALKRYSDYMRDVKAPSQKTLAYRDEFFTHLVDISDSISGSYVSRNGQRIYIPFHISNPMTSNVDMSSHYQTVNDDWGYRGTTHNRVVKALVDWAWDNVATVTNIDYINGYVDIDKNGYARHLKIGKCLKDKDLLKEYASDPIRLNKSITDKDVYIVFSKHPYDLVGMSTGRAWTSCTNIYNGENYMVPGEHYTHGAIVAYIIEKDDLNITNPIGRLMIMPWEVSRHTPGPIHLLGRRPTVYLPDPTIYSPYKGLDDVKQYIDTLILGIPHEHGRVVKKRDVYYDNYWDKNYCGKEI